VALLDTTAPIDLSRSAKSANHQRIATLVARLAANGHALCTSRINEAEFRVGGFRAADPVLEMAKINALLATLTILEFDSAAAYRVAQLQAQQLTAGRPVGGQADGMIATIALVNGQSLVTRNVRHFAGLTGLTVVAS
jgi:predicted nucleic acid-binding protein